MAFYPDVSPGQAFTPSAKLSNDVRHLVNRMNGFCSKMHSIKNNGFIRVQVYNVGQNAIEAGLAVNIDEASGLCDEALPVLPFTDAGKPWGVAVNALPTNEVGSCVLMGPVTIPVSGTGGYASPAANGTFTLGPTGSAKVLYHNGTNAIVLLGTASQEAGPTSPTGTIIAHGSNIHPSWDEKYILYLEPGYSGTSRICNMEDILPGWLYCNGSAVSRTTYANLFSYIGTVYGAGDGSTTFNLPDLRGRFLRGYGCHTGDSGTSDDYMARIGEDGYEQLPSVEGKLIGITDKNGNHDNHQGAFDRNASSFNSDRGIAIHGSTAAIAGTAFEFGKLHVKNTPLSWQDYSFDSKYGEYVKTDDFYGTLADYVKHYGREPEHFIHKRLGRVLPRHYSVNYFIKT